MAGANRRQRAVQAGYRYLELDWRRVRISPDGKRIVCGDCGKQGAEIWAVENFLPGSEGTEWEQVAAAGRDSYSAGPPLTA